MNFSNGPCRMNLRRCGMESSGSGQGPVAGSGSCDHCYELSGSVKVWEFRD